MMTYRDSFLIKYRFREIFSTIDMIHRYGFKVTANVMTGFPFMERDAQICDGIRYKKTVGL